MINFQVVLRNNLFHKVIEYRTCLSRQAGKEQGMLNREVMKTKKPPFFNEGFK